MKISSLLPAIAFLFCLLPTTGHAADHTVTSPADSGAGTLRALVGSAASGDTILFADAVSDTGITLLSELVIDKNLTIHADSLVDHPDGVTIRGGDTTRLFSVNAAGGNLTLRRLTLTEGGGVGATLDGSGGLIYNDGTLKLKNCTLSNSTADKGGAIYNEGNLTRTLTLTDCTISGNTATSDRGGAVYNDGTLTLTQCTLAGNAATAGSGAGGAVYNRKTLTATHSTISGNTAAIGGGICVFDGSRTSLRNSIIAGNKTAAGTPTDIGFSGAPLPAFNFTLTAPNLVGTNDSVESLFPAGPLVGTPALPLDPQLNPLGDYGGPTETMELRPGGPAVDAAVGTSLTTDQRGFERVLGDAADLGAYETSVGDFTLDGLTLFAGIPASAAGPGSTVVFQISADPDFEANVGVYAGILDSPALTNGPRLSAQFSYPTGAGQDTDGNFFIADTGNHRIRMISPSGQVTTIAGSGEGILGYGFSDGPGPSAQFAFPGALAVGTDDNLYVADTFNHSIRKVTRPAVVGQPWTVTTLAGTGNAGFTDGAGSSAQFNSPQGLTLDDDGNIFVADSNNHRIRKISPSGDSVTTYAGTGSPGVDEGPRTDASFHFPFGVAWNMDQSKLYVADRDNNRIRQITNDIPNVPPVLGTVSTYAGSGAAGFGDGASTTATFKSPVALAVDDKNRLFVADELNHAIRMVTDADGVSTVAGIGTPGQANGKGSVASFDCPAGIAIDRVFAKNSLVVADTQNHVLRRVAVDPIEVEVVLPDPLPPEPIPISAFIDVEALGLVPGTTYYTRWMSSPSGLTQDPPRSFLLFGAPAIVTETQTDVTATGAQLHAMVTPNFSTTRVVFEIAADAAMTAPAVVTAVPADSYSAPDPLLAPDPDTPLPVSAAIPQPGTAGETVYFRAVATNARGRVDGEVLSFTFPVTEVVTLAATGTTRTETVLNGTVNAKGSSTEVTFEYSTQSDLSGPWHVSTRAGRGTAGFLDSSSPTLAAFDTPQGVAVSGGSVYIADRLNHRIRKVAADGMVSTLAGSTVGFADDTGADAQFDHPAGVAADGSGNLYVADEHNHRIRKIVIATGEVTTLAGSVTAGLLDGNGGAAQFLFPMGVAVDAAGNIYVADTGNHCIRRIGKDAPYPVTTIGGTGVAGFADGEAGAGQFNSPQALAVNAAGEILVADTGNNAIRKISAAGAVTTLAGTGTTGFLDGPGISAQFASPSGIVLDGTGMLYVADRDNHRIRRIAADGLTSTLAGSGVAGLTNSPAGMLHPATVTEFNLPSGVASDATGTLWVTEEGNHDLRQVARLPLPTVVAAQSPLVGASVVPVNAPINGLLAGTPYYFRAVGTNAIGPIAGDILSVTTLTNPKIAVFDGPATPPPPELQPAQTEVVDFGTTPTGTPVTRHFTIANLGQWPLAINSITVPAGFAFTGGAGPVPPAGSVDLEVTLSATTGATPAGDVTITSDDPTQLTFTFPIAGVVRDPPTVTTLSATSDGSIFTLNALINPEGSLTMVGFEYGPDPELDGLLVGTLAGAIPDYAEGTGAAARFDQPNGVATDAAGNVYVADTLNHRIRRITPGGVSSTFAGTGVPGFLDGPPGTARFNEPLGVVINAAGTLFVADSKNHRIRAISPTGQVSTYAGFGEANFTEGVGTAARFNLPSGLAIDGAGVLYVADRLNHRVRKVALDQTVSTLAGTGAGGSLNSPRGIAVSQNGTVYLTEVSAHHIKRITSGGTVSVFAGGASGFANGLGAAARFANPAGLVIDAMGRLLVADSGNHRIRMIELGNAKVTTIAGSGTPGTVDGEGSVARFASPVSLATNAAGDVFVGETTNSVIRRIVSTTVVVEIESSLEGTFDTATVSYPIAEPPAGTTYYYRAFASNFGGMSMGIIKPEGNSPTPPPFAEWQTQMFGAEASDPLIAGMYADPNNDGVVNLLNYAFFMDPHEATRTGMPVVSVAGDVVTLTYTRVIGATDLIYTTEWSTDMLSWSSAGVSEQILSSNADTQQVAASIPCAGASMKCLRVRVTLQQP